MALKASILALSILLALPVSAQQLPGVDALTLQTLPQYPRPYDTITITPHSTLVNLAASSMSISVNGSVVSTTRSATIRLGGPGSATAIRVVVTAPNGEVYTDELTIRPAEVSLIVEANSTTHPLYEGAALPAAEGRVRLIALPDFRSSPGARIPTSSLVYTWRLGSRILEDSSGIGRSTLIATAPVRYRDAIVTLTVATPDGSVSAETRVTVSPTDSLVRIYRYDPLLGPWYSGALFGSLTLSGSEDTFRAVPYFFSSAPTIAWSIDGVERRRGPDLTVRTEDNARGVAAVGVSATGASATERAAQALSVRFGSERQGIFGF